MTCSLGALARRDARQRAAMSPSRRARRADAGAAAAAVLLTACLLLSGGGAGATQATPRSANASSLQAAAASAAQQLPPPRSSPHIPVLKCQPCELMHCVPKKASKLKCRGGTTTGICGCCHECAKVEGELCGGDWHYLGKCDAGLYCSPGLPSSVDHRNGIPEGKCRRVRDTMMDSSVPAGLLHYVGTAGGGGGGGLPLAGQRQLDTCEPKCTPDFCERRPRAICSAIDVVDVKRDCHGKCQHTSCQACSWVEPPVDCGACRSDDFDCLRRFASCVRRQHCTRDRFPCQTRKTTTPATTAAAAAALLGSRLGKFQCEIPRCQER